jgi:hypothetical protein
MHRLTHVWHGANVSTVGVCHYIMDGSDWNEGVDESEHGIVDRDIDDYDEESMLARVLLESQSSFLLEQQNIYQGILAADTKVDQIICSHSNNFADDTTNNNNSFSQWYDYRQYNSSREVTSSQGHNAACNAYASIRDFVVDDDRDFDSKSKDMFKEEKEESLKPHVHDDEDDQYAFERFQSFRKNRSRRQCFRSRSHEDNYMKMPSQSSIFTSSTCAETTATTASSAALLMEEQREQEESELDNTSPSSSSLISDDMVILEQIRILRNIQEQQLLQANRNERPTTTKSEYFDSKIPARDDFNNFLNESCADGATETQRPTKVTSTSSAITMFDPTAEMAATYSHDVIVPYPDGISTVRIRGLQHLSRRTLECRQQEMQQDNNEVGNFNTNDDDNIITTQCTHCSTLSQVVRSTCAFLYCVQCQEISPIVPISCSDVIEILQRQQEQQQL